MRPDSSRPLSIHGPASAAKVWPVGKETLSKNLSHLLTIEKEYMDENLRTDFMKFAFEKRNQFEESKRPLYFIMPVEGAVTSRSGKSNANY